MVILLQQIALITGKWRLWSRWSLSNKCRFRCIYWYWWSSGAWGEGTFGSTTALSATNQLRLWTHDHFGENLIINP